MTNTLTLLWTLKSESEAINSSSSRVAEEADIRACCCAGVSSWLSACSFDTSSGAGLEVQEKKRNQLNFGALQVKCTYLDQI